MNHPLPPFDPWHSVTIAGEVAAATRASAEVLAARRDERLRALFAAARRSRVYAKVIGRRDPATLSLADFPVQRKSALMQRFDEWVCDPALRLDELGRFLCDPGRVADAWLDRYTVWESSGSSGEPGVFVQDAAAMAVYDALEALRRPVLRPLQRWVDPWSVGETIAFVGALGGHFASTVSIERLRRLNVAMAGQLHSISFLQPTARIVDALNALRPTVLATYPSAAVMLAGEQLDGRLAISPAELWTGGETLSPSMRAHVEQVFNCRVADSYGASEFLAMASECVCGALHLNADWVVLEPVDAAGRPVPPGEVGATTLLTNLANHVQPLIRYDIGDRVRLLPTACACGSSLPVIEVEGRCDDTLLLDIGGERRGVPVLPLALSTVLEDEAGLFDFQLVQQGPADLLLRTGLRGSAAVQALRRGRSTLQSFLAAQGAPGVHIHCRSDEPCRRGPSGKVQRIVRQPLRH